MKEKTASNTILAAAIAQPTDIPRIAVIVSSSTCLPKTFAPDLPDASIALTADE